MRDEHHLSIHCCHPAEQEVIQRFSGGGPTPVAEGRSLGLDCTTFIRMGACRHWLARRTVARDRAASG